MAVGFACWPQLSPDIDGRPAAHATGMWRCDGRTGPPLSSSGGSEKFPKAVKRRRSQGLGGLGGGDS